MKVCVLGLWHLGTVTAACLAAGGHDVTGLDFDEAVVAGLAAGTPPLFEPGLSDLVKAGLAAGRLRFTTDAASAVDGADVVWVTYDTPVDDEDRADVEYVVERAAAVCALVGDGTLVLISSQVPVGTTRRLEQGFAKTAAGRARRICLFSREPSAGCGDRRVHADRIVSWSAHGRSPIATRSTTLFRPFTDRIEWMSVESAEMTKHALNAFLATSVTFINEIASLCEQVGADATEVARGLKSEARIGPKAYVSPGGAFAGGTLARDVVFLSQLGQERGVATHLLSSVKTSNDAHRSWAQRRLTQLLRGLAGRTVAVWGLTYKPGTDTLRRSSAVELCRWLHEQGAIVCAHDPAVKELPEEIAAHVRLAATPVDAVSGASALVVATPWPGVPPGGGESGGRADDAAARARRQPFPR